MVVLSQGSSCDGEQSEPSNEIRFGVDTGDLRTVMQVAVKEMSSPSRERVRHRERERERERNDFHKPMPGLVWGMTTQGLGQGIKSSRNMKP